MAGFDNETVYFNNIDPRGVVPVEPQMVENGQLLIGDENGNPQVNTLTAGTNISIINGPGSILISASGGGGGGGSTSLGVDASTAPGTNPVVPDGGDIIDLTGVQVSSNTISTSIRTNSTQANQVRIEIQRSSTSGSADTARNGVSHYNSAQFTVDSNGFVSQAASVPLSFPTDSGTATPSSNMLNVVTLANDGIATSGSGNSVTITSANDLAAIEALATTGYAVRTGAETWALRTFQEGAGIDLTNPAGTSGDTTIAVDVTELPTVATTYQADSGSATPSLNVLSVVGGTGGIDTSAAGSMVTINFDVTETSIATTYAADTGSATPSMNTINIVSAANDGIATSGSGSTITITSADDLAALEALAGTGFATRTGANTWANRTFIQGTGITISNPAGIAGDPTITATGDVAITFEADTGTATPVLNNIKIFGGEGIDTSASGDTVTIAGEDATTVNKGIASFLAADFDVAAGAVSLEDTVVKLVGSDSGSATPVAHTFNIVGVGGISTSASGSTITVSGSTSGLTWREEVGTSATYVANEGIFANNALTVTLTLPASPTVGNTFAAYQEGAGKVRIAQNASDQIRLGNLLSTSGVAGYIESKNVGDCVTLVAIDGNRFRAISSEGSWTVA